MKYDQTGPSWCKKGLKKYLDRAGAKNKSPKNMNYTFLENNTVRANQGRMSK